MAEAVVAVGKGGIAAAVLVGGAGSALGFWGFWKTRLWAVVDGPNVCDWRLHPRKMQKREFVQIQTWMFDRRWNSCAKAAVSTLITQ